MENINIKINSCISMFNITAERIGKHLVNEFPGNLHLYSYDSIVTSIIRKNPRSPIDLFADHIFTNDKYRQAILDGDENFFKENRHENLTSSDEDRIKAMFQFKSCWGEMSDASKEYVKRSMTQLVIICGQYIELMCKIQDYKKKL